MHVQKAVIAPAQTQFVFSEYVWGVQKTVIAPSQHRIVVPLATSECAKHAQAIVIAPAQRHTAVHHPEPAKHAQATLIAPVKHRIVGQMVDVPNAKKTVIARVQHRIVSQMVCVPNANQTVIAPVQHRIAAMEAAQNATTIFNAPTRQRHTVITVYAVCVQTIVIAPVQHRIAEADPALNV